MLINLNKNSTADYHVNEAYKSLMANVQFCGNNHKIIAITSCTPNEGKSSISLNLAISLAEAGKKVIFIDGDLRKSVLVGRYKISQKIKGLSHFLSGQNEFGEVINDTNVHRLQVVFAGPTPPNPSELLGSNRFKSVLQALRNVYDYIIIDTPPLGSVIDAAIIAKECDGAVMVIESKAISYKFARKVKEQLGKANCTLLGVVMNKVNLNHDKYYGRYYGKYYGEYKHA